MLCEFLLPLLSGTYTGRLTSISRRAITMGLLTVAAGIIAMHYT